MRVELGTMPRALAPTMVCTLCHGEVPLQLVESRPEVTAADLADERADSRALVVVVVVAAAAVVVAVVRSLHR